MKQPNYNPDFVNMDNFRGQGITIRGRHSAVSEHYLFTLIKDHHYITGKFHYKDCQAENVGKILNEMADELLKKFIPENNEAKLRKLLEKPCWDYEINYCRK